MRDGEPRRIRTGLEVCIEAGLTAGRSKHQNVRRARLRVVRNMVSISISPDRDAEMSLGGGRYAR